MSVNNPPSAPLTLANSSTSNALLITQTGNASNSTSVGGALCINNTSSTGAGLVVYTNQDATASGPLFSARSDNDLFDQRCISSVYHGTTHGVFIDHQGTGNASIGLNVTSINDADTAFGVSGRESGRGTIKVTHFKPDGIADTNASAVSVNRGRVNAAETTLAQGIFMDSDHATTTNMLNLKDNGSTVLTLTPALMTVTPSARFNGTIGFNNTAAISKPTVSGAKGSNAALASLLTALANYGLVTDSTTA